MLLNSNSISFFTFKHLKLLNKYKNIDEVCVYNQHQLRVILSHLGTCSWGHGKNGKRGHEARSESQWSGRKTARGSLCPSCLPGIPVMVGRWVDNLCFQSLNPTGWVSTWSWTLLPCVATTTDSQDFASLWLQIWLVKYRDGALSKGFKSSGVFLILQTERQTIRADQGPVLEDSRTA